MPDYAYNLVYRLNGRDVVEEHLTPHAFAGTPEDFGMAMLLDLIARIPAVGDEFVAVNVWYSDREGVGVPGPHRVLVSALDLDPGPFPGLALAPDLMLRPVREEFRDGPVLGCYRDALVGLLEDLG